MINELKKIGVLYSTYGIKGELKFKLDKQYLINKDIVNQMFFLKDHNNNFDVYKIKKSYFIKNKHIIGFEEIDSINKAEKLINNLVYIKNNSSFIKEKISYLNYKWFYNNLNMGQIKDEMFNNAQILLKVNYKNIDIWVPIVEFYLQKIDNQKKEIYFKNIEVLI